MTRRNNKNVLSKWLKDGQVVLLDGRFVPLANLLELPNVDEADVAAAVLFGEWSTPEEFWRTVCREQKDRIDHEKARREEIEKLEPFDLEEFLLLGKTLATDASEAKIRLECKLPDGTKRVVEADLDQMLERVRRARAEKEAK